MSVSNTGKPVKSIGYKLKENYNIERKPRYNSFKLYCGSIAGKPAVCNG